MLKNRTIIAHFVFTLLVLTSLFFTSLGITPAYAASIIVTTNADSIANDSFCTLREAITNANNNSQLFPSPGECGFGVGTDTITFAGNYTITLVGAELPVVTTAITIKGNGAANTIIQANASPKTATYRVFTTSGNSGNLTLDSLTVRHGWCTGGCDFGGGIYKGGNSSLTVINSTISGNSAPNGGGIYNGIDGSLTIINSTISGNSASGNGGGIYNKTSTLNITNSTLSGNSATNGGGIYNSGVLTVTNTTLSGNNVTNNGGGIYNSDTAGDLTLTNSTISSNSASANGGGIYNAINKNLGIYNSTLNGNKAAMGGGIYNDGNLWLGNATISGNEAYDYGGGIYSDGSAWIHNSTIVFNTLVEGTNLGAAGVDGNVAFYNSLVAGNTRILTSEYRDCSGDSRLFGMNLFTNVTNCTFIENPSLWSYLNSLSTLGPLQANGGPTWTHALLPGSNAIETGDNNLCASWPINNLDQRGVPRPQGASCDVGAYEANAITSTTYKSTGSYDGWILESSETSNTGGTLNSAQTTFILGDDAADKQYRAILHFDTSTLPDTAVVTNMTLKIKQQGSVTGTSPFSFGSLYVDMRNPAFGGSALELTDFNFTAKKVKPAVFNPNPVSGWFSARFNNGGKLYVNRTGVSQLRLYFSVDDNNNSIADFIRFFSGNAAAGDRPKLLVQYYVP